MLTATQKRRLRILLCILVGIVVLTTLFYALELIPTSFWKHLFAHEEVRKEIITHWRSFTNNECGYVVSFPSKPFENPQALGNRQNVISYRQFVSVIGSNQVFVVATLVTSLTNTYSDEQNQFLMDRTMKGALGAGGKLLAKRDTTLGTNVGREFEFQKPDGYFVKMCCYQVGHNLQTLTVRVPLANRDSTNISHFFDSFRLISE